MWVFFLNWKNHLSAHTSSSGSSSGGSSSGSGIPIAYGMSAALSAAMFVTTSAAIPRSEHFSTVHKSEPVKHLGPREIPKFPNTARIKSGAQKRRSITVIEEVSAWNVKNPMTSSHEKHLSSLGKIKTSKIWQKNTNTVKMWKSHDILLSTLQIYKSFGKIKKTNVKSKV